MRLSTKLKPKRKRGGQSGNRNALKHGFYSRYFTELENSDLDLALATDLSDDIAQTRVALRRCFDQAKDDRASLDLRLQAAEVAGKVLTALTRALIAQKQLQGETLDSASILSQALAGLNVQPHSD
jgi:hypothetical protein